MSETLSPRPPFSGATALVIGGGNNIGRAVALEFARRGARIAVADLDPAGAEETASRIRAIGAEAIGLACDVTDTASMRAMARAAEARFGPMDIVMNNAGILSGGNPEDIPLAAWQQMMDVNFFGMIRSNEIFLPGMIARGHGHIVNTASFAGAYPYATSRMHYAASKAAIISMSENLALYGEPLGVKVSCLIPGPVMTSIPEGMRHFSENYQTRMPGSHLVLKSQAEAARALADGMAEGRILIPTDAALWDTLREWAASPDGFIRAKAEAFAAGDNGKPQVPEEFLRAARTGA